MSSGNSTTCEKVAKDWGLGGGFPGYSEMCHTQSVMAVPLSKKII